MTRNDTPPDERALRSRIDAGDDRHGGRRASPTCRDGCRASGCTRRTSSTRCSAHGTEGCNYLLARRRRHEHRRRLRDHRRGRRATATWCSTSTWTPCGCCRWLPGTAMVQCDLTWLDGAPGAPVAAHDPAAPGRPARPSAASTAFAGTELEFIVFDDTYEAAWDAGYRGLTPANQYNVDYSILGTTRVEPLLRDIRNTMYAAGHDGRGAKGECNLGQHEIAFRYADVLTHRRQPRRLQERRQGDRRAARQGADVHGEVQRARGQLLPHPPVAARARDGELVFWDDEQPAARYAALRHVHRRRAGHDGASSPCCTRRTSTPTSGSPTARSRRRRSPGARTTAPARCALVGHGAGRGWRTGCPAATSTPTWRSRRCSPAGCTASRTSCELEPALDGQRLHLRQAHACRARCATARDAVRRVRGRPRRVRRRRGRPLRCNAADVELAAFDAAVTDWELRRGFERL